MKHPSPRDARSRFSGTLRHYHRSGSQPQRTWEEWIDGKPKPATTTNWVRVLVIVVAVIGLIGIVAGLFIELS